jgi:hypothetical protein
MGLRLRIKKDELMKENNKGPTIVCLYKALRKFGVRPPYSILGWREKTLA